MLPFFAQVTNISEVNAASTNSSGTNAGPSEVNPEKDAEISSEDAAEMASEPSAISEFFDSGAIGLLIDGGVFMWPILIMAILALAVIIERWRSLKMLDTDNEALRQAVLEDLTNDRIEDALARCDRERGPVAAILANGLRKYLVLSRLNYDPARLEEQVVKSMESYGVHIVAALERHLPVLAIVSSVAPMLGFLGTVQGMIVAFHNIVEMDKTGGGNIIQAAAAGIEVALLTTCFGLMVGIPAFMAFNYFSSVINNFVLEVEESAAELMEAVTLQLTLNSEDKPES
ncbi:MAG: MotA/TolQ/ExbB proton channel family protein [Verrucomicrobiota bacterium]|nr:MotA/TolQ/ExbB proton channel family protein [Verrucomicrobiota bacterium]